MSELNLTEADLLTPRAVAMIATAAEVAPNMFANLIDALKPGDIVRVLTEQHNEEEAFNASKGTTPTPFLDLEKKFMDQFNEALKQSEEAQAALGSLIMSGKMHVLVGGLLTMGWRIHEEVVARQQEQHAPQPDADEPTEPGMVV